MAQYCVYCAYCVQDEGNGLSCMSYDKEMTMNAARRDNKCPNYQTSPLGHVITGKQYRPQKWREMRAHSNSKADREF